MAERVGSPGGSAATGSTGPAGTAGKGRSTGGGAAGAAGTRETAGGHAAPGRAKVIAAFAAVYVIWGSTYLGILYAIETMPPFLMAAARFLAAGALLYGWTWMRGAGRPAPVHWAWATLVGGLLLAGGNGGVVWAEQRVATGLAALLIATVPLWMVLLEWVRPLGTRPTARIAIGLIIGMAGLALLVGPAEFMGQERMDLVGAGVLLTAALLWATGSIVSRGARLPSSPLQATAMQMLAGGAILLLVGMATGETTRLDLAAVSMRSLLALVYLILFGSLVGYTAYIWLLRVSTPARVSTYAYVNPVVAVLLGWAFAGESITLRIAVAAAVIVGAVAVITTGRSRAGVRSTAAEHLSHKAQAKKPPRSAQLRITRRRAAG